jgi:hypothetical protein
MRKLLLVGTCLATLTGGPSFATTQLPSKFLGSWCEIGQDTGGRDFQRGPCRDREGKVNRNGTYKTMIVSADGFLESGGVPCGLLAIAESKKGNYLTIFECAFEKNSLTVGFWWSLNKNGELRLDIINPVKRWHPMDM